MNLSQRHGQRNRNETCDQTTDPSDLVLLYQRCTRVANSNRTTTVTRIGQWTTHIPKRKCANPCPTVNSTSHQCGPARNRFWCIHFSAQEYTELNNLHCHPTSTPTRTQSSRSQPPLSSRKCVKTSNQFVFVFLSGVGATAS